MKPIIIFGLKRAVKTAYLFTNDTPYEVAAFTVHQRFLNKKKLLGLDIIPFESLETIYSPERYSIFIDLGYTGVNKARAEIYESCKRKGYELVTYISSKAIHWNKFEIGDNSTIHAGANIGLFVKIGSNTIINPGAVISHDSIVGDHCFIGTNAVINGKVTIGDYTLIGSNATLIDGIKTGKKCVIGAGVIITKDLEDGALYLPKEAEKMQMDSNVLAQYQYANLNKQFNQEDFNNVNADHCTFPLTPIQQAYWVGRNREMTLGGVSTHFYYEIESDKKNVSKLTQALRHLIDRHPMLRTVISPSGKQYVLENTPPYKINTIDLKNTPISLQEEKLKSLRSRLSHQVLNSNQWPLFDIRIVLLGERKLLFFLCIDSLLMDGHSQNLFFTEWKQLYYDLNADLQEVKSSFYNYILQLEASRESDSYKKDAEYWRKRIPSLPPSPKLPFSQKLSELKQNRFSRYEERLDPSIWNAFKKEAGKRGFRPAAVILAAFAETLRLWSSDSKMTLVLTILDKISQNQEFNGVIGNFTSTLLLEVNQERKLSFEEFIRQLQKQLETDLKHSSFSGVEVLRELIKENGNELDAPMPVVFTSCLSADQRQGGKNPLAWLGKTKYALTQTPQVCLDYQTHEYDGSFIGIWDVVEDLFPERMIKDMFASHLSFLKELATGSDIWSESAEQRIQRLIPPYHLNLYKRLNATNHPRAPKLLYEPFLFQAQKKPDQTAIISDERTLTYTDLEKESAVVANWLQQDGAGPNQLIAVVMGKGWEQIVAVIGILRSGAAYLPIDPASPKQRLHFLLKDGNVRIVLTQPRFSHTLDWPEHINYVTIEEEKCVNDGISEIKSKYSTPAVKPGDLAYVIYTSGSTGLPKGVMITHQNANNSIEDIIQRFNVKESDRVLAISSLSFDLSVFDIFGLLSVGGTIVLPAAKDIKDPSCWHNLINLENITIWNSVPALMQLLLDYSLNCGKRLENMRLILLSGDWIPLDLPDMIRRQVPNSEIVSLGGATEASIWSILYKIDNIDPSWKSIPYGRPMQNQRFYVFDDLIELRPVWVPGELYIGGYGLADGYWHNEERTEQYFITHPNTGERLYKTGDIGRLHKNGYIELLGRSDYQVKIRGYRIEPEEIESVLTQHPKVSKAVVMSPDISKGKNHLTAFVLQKNNEQITEEELYTFIRNQLPEYMLPSNLVIVDQFPLSENGKLDRQALGMITSETEMNLINLNDSKENLNTIINIAEEVTDIKGIEPNNQIINLGATSIDVIRFINRIEQKFGIRLNVDEIYGAKDFYHLSEILDNKIKKASSSLKSAMSVEKNQKNSASDIFLKDPADREKFRNSLRGLRKDLEDKEFLTLPDTNIDSGLFNKLFKRQSHRHYKKEAIPLEDLAKLLKCLMGRKENGGYKYFYGSAGKLYPVQSYLFVKSKRVNGIEAGIYYYHPLKHQLIRFSSGSGFPGEIYTPLINRPIFDEAAFAVFMIADLSAILPMYGEKSMHYATLEAGLMTQLLEENASKCNIGLCQIGELDFNTIRSYFNLNNDHVLIHSLLGGRI